MSITAKVSSTEIENQIADRFVGSWYEVALLNSSGFLYEPGVTSEEDTMSHEVDPVLFPSYSRQTFTYTQDDVSTYTDDGVGLNTKAAIFEHDGATDAFAFTHVVLLWGESNVSGITAATSAPSVATDGVYDTVFPTVSSGGGTGMTVRLSVTNSGATPSDYTVVLNGAGKGYTPGDELRVAGLDLINAGVTSEDTDIVFSVDTVTSAPNTNKIISVAKLANTATLSNGQQAGFYFNLKQFGYYQV